MLLIFYYKVTNTIILLIFNEKLKFNRKVFIQPPRHEDTKKRIMSIKKYIYG